MTAHKKEQVLKYLTTVQSLLEQGRDALVEIENPFDDYKRKTEFSRDVLEACTGLNKGLEDLGLVITRFTATMTEDPVPETPRKKKES